MGILLSKNMYIKIHRTIILSVLYGCESLSLTLREERWLRVSENRLLRRIFGPKTDEVKGERRKLHTEELNDMYSSPNIFRLIKSKRMRWADHVAHMGRKGVCTGFWWGNLKERDHWEDPSVDGRIVLRWIFRKWVKWGMDRIDLCQDRDRRLALVSAVINLRVP
jgi:hypothetical protein